MYCKLVFPPEEIFKLSSFPQSYEDLVNAVNARLETHLINKFTLKYMDSEKELVNITCNEDLETAVMCLEAENIKGLKVHVLPDQKSESPQNAEPKFCDASKKLEVKTNDLNNSGLSFDSNKEQRSADKNPTFCCECYHDILNIKYVCPECHEYKICTECEEKVDHEHALLKVRVSVGQKSQLSTSQLSYSGRVRMSEKKTQELSDKSTMKRISILKNNSATTTTTSKKPIYAGRIFLENENGNLVNVKSEEQFEILVTVKNTGKENWPSNLKLVCVNGAFRNTSVKILSLSAGCKQHLHISLKAPAQTGKYLSQWRIYYQDEDKPKSFGESLFFDTQVKEENKINERFSTYKLRSSQITKEKITTTRTDNGEKKVLNIKNIKIALYLNEIFPGLLQEKVDFLNNMNDVNENNIINIVEQYLVHSVKNQKKSMESGELHIKQCQEVLVPSS